MRCFVFRNVTGCAVLSALLMMTLVNAPARGAFIATATQVGSNVVATGSGTIDTAALTFKPSQDGGDYDSGYSFSLAATFGIGPAASTLVDKYSGINGPSNFGSGVHVINATSGSGDIVEVANYFSVLDVPSGYVSGSPLSDTSTFNNQTFASMGMTPGVYQWNWGSGPTADSYTLTIGAVPEPCSVGLFSITGLCLLGR